VVVFSWDFTNFLCSILGSFFYFFYNLLFSCFASEMGAKAKKAMKKNLKKASSQLVASARKTEAADFLVCWLCLLHSRFCLCIDLLVC
jgi:hypothetical protein